MAGESAQFSIASVLEALDVNEGAFLALTSPSPVFFDPEDEETPFKPGVFQANLIKNSDNTASILVEEDGYIAYNAGAGRTHTFNENMVLVAGKAITTTGNATFKFLSLNPTPVADGIAQGGYIINSGGGVGSGSRLSLGFDTNTSACGSLVGYYDAVAGSTGGMAVGLEAGGFRLLTGNGAGVTVFSNLVLASGKNFSVTGASTLTSNAATTIPLRINLATGQTVPAIAVYASDGATVLSKIDSGGNGVFGQAQVGTWSGFSSVAEFKHKDAAFPNDYTLLSSAGGTYLNASTGQTVSLRIFHAEIANISSTGLTLASGKTLSQAGTGTRNLWSFGDETGATWTWAVGGNAATGVRLVQNGVADRVIISESYCLFALDAIVYGTLSQINQVAASHIHTMTAATGQTGDFIRMLASNGATVLSSISALGKGLFEGLEVGDVGQGAAYPGIKKSGQSSNRYALIQDGVGQTYINGQTVIIRNDNTTVGYFDSTGLTLASGKNLRMSLPAASAVNPIEVAYAGSTLFQLDSESRLHLGTSQAGIRQLNIAGGSSAYMSFVNGGVEKWTVGTDNFSGAGTHSLIFYANAYVAYLTEGGIFSTTGGFKVANNYVIDANRRAFFGGDAAGSVIQTLTQATGQTGDYIRGLASDGSTVKWKVDSAGSATFGNMAYTGDWQQFPSQFAIWSHKNYLTVANYGLLMDAATGDTILNSASAIYLRNLNTTIAAINASGIRLPLGTSLYHNEVQVVGARGAALTAADAGTINSGDATTDTVIANMRTRINELEARLSSVAGHGLFT